MTVYGWAPNGTNIGIGMDVWYEGAVNWDSTAVTVYCSIRFACAYSTLDANNTLSWWGHATGSRSGFSWTTAKTNCTTTDITNAKTYGTAIGDQIHIFSISVPLITGESQWIDFGAQLANVENAGGTFSVVAGVTVPARPEGLGSPTITNASPTMGTTVTIDFNRVSTAHTMDCMWFFGGASGYILGTGNGDYFAQETVDWNFPVATLAPRIPNATSGTGTIRCYYHDSNNNYIGSKDVSFTAYYPTGASYNPTGGTVTLSESNSAVTTVMGAMTNTFVQNQSKISAAYAGQAGVYGSTVSKVEIIIDGTTYLVSASPWVSPTIGFSGAKTLTKRVTDSRGRITDVNVSITSLAYNTPAITSFTVDRALSNGTISSSGTYGKATSIGAISPLQNAGVHKNILTYTLNSRLKGTTPWTTRKAATNLAAGTTSLSATETIGDGSFSAASSYEFQLIVADKFQSINVIYTMPTEIIPLAIGKTGIATGKGTSTGALYPNGSIEATGNLHVDGSIYTGGNVYIQGQMVSAIPPASIQAYAGVTVPAGWLKCDGATYNKADYPNLAAALGYVTTTFTVPNLKGRVIVGIDSTQTEFDTRLETGGAKTHTLAASEMPSHTHNTDAGLVNAYGAGTSTPAAWGSSIGFAFNTAYATSSTGGGGAHNNLQPYMAMDFIIKT